MDTIPSAASTVHRGQRRLATVANVAAAGSCMVRNTENWRPRGSEVRQDMFRAAAAVRNAVTLAST
ncbi:MAG: hypothetical protein WCP29_09090 [Acidobacteriota bacterium]